MAALLYYSPSFQENRFLSPGFCLERGVVVARQTKLGDTLGSMRLRLLSSPGRRGWPG
jgi:hypothetical protein